MRLIWKVPGEPPDRAAIMRMRQHFQKPDKVMPVAWFMGEIEFYDSFSQTSPKTLDAKEVCRALGDIAGGIFSFPEVEYVPVWKAWFKYLLPDLILRADDPANFNSYDLWILVKAITTCFNVYPQQIAEEYPGFRDDLVATLGSRAIPQKLAREQMTQKDEASPLFADIWDERQTIENYGFVSLQEVNSSILFCLKYSTVVELAEWTASLFQIDSPQWHLQLIFSLMEWRIFLNLARKWNHDEQPFLGQILKQSSMCDEFCIPNFKSLTSDVNSSTVKTIEHRCQTRV